MAQEEEVILLRVDTGEAVKSVGDLRENIKQYKQALETAEVGSETFKAAQKGLTQSQNALRSAMHASTASMEDVAKAAQGMGTSYNALVYQMAQLKEEFRATTDAARRADLGAQIKEINDQLKEMDAQQGNFQRNVGNYTESVQNALKGVVADMPSFLEGTRKGLDDVTKSMGLMVKNPLFGLILLIGPALQKMVQSLKENETAMEAVRKVGQALQPFMDAAAAVVQKIAEWLGVAATKIADFVGKSDLFRKVVANVSGVGNAILQAIVTPVKTAVEAFKGLGKIIGDIFKGNFKDIPNDAREAGRNIRNALSEGLSVKANFDEGKAAGENFAAGLKSSTPKAKEAGTAAGQAYVEGWREELDKMLADSAAAAEGDSEYAGIADGMMQQYAAQQEAERKNQEELAKIQRAGEEALKKDYEQFQKDKTAAAEAAAENMAKAWEASVAAVADVMGSLADIYEANADDSEASEKRVKALRIASATIQTIQGAIGAYMQAASSIPAPFGLIVGAAQAATVTAAGVANIAKMRSTSLSGSGASTASPKSASFSSAAASSPATATQSPLSWATFASDTQALNSIGSQRVYILASDLEANENARKVQIAETSY